LPRFRGTIGAVPAPRDGLRAVLYDWDGTLVDSAEKSYQCYVKVFSSFGIPYDRASYEKTYSPDWYQTYVAVGLPRDRWAEADALWTRAYEREPSRLLPGARAALERMARGGTAQGLVSSGEASRVRRELGEHSLEGFFGTAVVCGGETERRKPHPEPLLAGLEKLGVGPAEAVYVGDSPEDVAMAKAAGVRVVGIPGGFPNREALAASGPDLLAPSLEAAVDALLSLGP
jgi:HAD superfamily hydrolase (TIGR01509 family)